MKISFSSGRFTAGQLDAFAIPNVPAGAPIVFYGHGAGGDGGEIVGNNFLYTVPPIIQALVKAGFVVIAPTSTSQWGNAVADARLDAGLAYARSVFKASNDPPSGLGISHGFPMLANYALDHAFKSLFGIIPAADVQAIRVADTLGLRASIDLAHGITYPAAMPAGSNPSAETGILSGLPMDIWYANNDAVSANVTTFIAATGATGHDVGALGHGNNSILAVPVASVVAFLKAHL